MADPLIDEPMPAVNTTSPTPDEPRDYEVQRLRRALSESEERFRIMADYAPVLLWISGTDGLCTFFNRPWLEFTGRPLEQELGDGWAAGVHPDDVERCLEVYRTAFAARKPFEMEYRLRRADGEYRLLMDHAGPIFRADGTFAGFIGSCIDITEAKLAAQARERQDATLNEQAQLVDLAYDGIIVYDYENGAIKQWNRGAEAMYGWTKDEALGRHIHTLLQTEFPQPLSEVRAAIAQGVHWEGELRHQTKQGDQIVVVSRWAIQRDAEGQPSAVLEINRDITERKRAEEERARLLAAEQAARARAEHAVERVAALQSVTAGLSEALSPTQVGTVIADLGAAALNATAAYIVRLSLDGQELEVIGASGYSQAQVERWMRFPLDSAVPLAEAVRTGQAVWLQSRAERIARYPHLATAYVESDYDSWISVPMQLEGRVIGGMSLSFAEHRKLTTEDRELLMAVAQQCGQALERVRLFEAEHQLRAAAEAAEHAKAESLALLNTLFATAPVGLAFFDRELRYVRVNEAMAAMNGVPVEAHVGRSIKDVLPHMTDDVVVSLRHVLETGVPLIGQEVQGETPAAPGESRTWIVSYYQVRGLAGTMYGLGAVVQEITERKRAEAQLRENEARYRTLFESIDEGLCVIEMLFDADGAPHDYRFLETNPMFESQTGLIGAVGKTARELVPALEQHWFDLYGTIALTGEAQRFVQGSDAMDRWFDVYAFRHGGPESRRVGILFKDITERKRAEEAQQFILEASTVLSASLDYEATLRWLAQLIVPRMADWCAIDMLERDGLIRRLEVAHVDPAKVALAKDVQQRYPSDPNAQSGVARVLRTGECDFLPDITDEMLEATVKDPELLRIIRELGLKSSMIVPMVVGGKVMGAISFVAAESGRRFDTQDLALAEDLAYRAVLAVENARLYREAQQAIEARDDFLSIASHELKTPLTSLQLQAQSLLRAARKQTLATQPPERLLHKMELIDQQANRLTRLANDLLDVARIRSGRIEFQFENVDIAALIREVAGRFEEQLSHAGCTLTLDLDEPLHLRTDRSQLDQVLTNLLGNAIKYGAGKPVEIRAAVQQQQLQIVVRDHGIGIAPADQDRIWSRFERAVSSRNYGGLGLGLYIVRQIVEALGGTVAITSAVGAGATFTVTLPPRSGATIARASIVE